MIRTVYLGSQRNALRAGFTAIELLVVLTVVIILVSLSVPGLLGAMRHGRVSDAVNSVARVSSQARQFARTRAVPSDPAHAAEFYGIVIVAPEIDGGAGAITNPGYVALTYGTSADISSILGRAGPGVAIGPANEAVSKLNINKNVIVYDESGPLASKAVIGWGYQYRTGYPIQLPGSATSKAIDVGVPVPNALKQQISMRTLDGKYRTAVAVYRIGLSNVQDF